MQIPGTTIKIEIQYTPVEIIPIHIQKSSFLHNYQFQPNSFLFYNRYLLAFEIQKSSFLHNYQFQPNSFLFYNRYLLAFETLSLMSPLFIRIFWTYC
jgi:hypothetical protein